MILLSSFFRDLQLLLRGKEPSRTSIPYYPSHFCLPCPVLPRGVATFQEEETKGSRANPRIWEKLPKKRVLVPGTVLTVPTAIAQHSDALEHPSCLDLFCLFEESGMHVWAVTRS